MGRKRVIVWGTGHLGASGLRMVLQHPDLELVGVHAWSSEKIGRDAGALAGTGPTGITVTNNIQDLLQLKADCIAYFASSACRDAEAMADILPFLESGTNVSTISHFDLQYPRHGRPQFVEPVERACRTGSASVLLTGEEPGFAFGQHLFALLSTTGRVDRIDMIELAYVRRYAGADSLRMYGFNEDLDYRPPMFKSEVGAVWHVNTLRGIADFVGVTIDAFEESWETATVGDDYETAAFGMASAGKTAATRWTVTGMVKGSPFLVYQKILRLHEEAGKDWPAPILGKAGPGVTQKISVTGSPNIREELHRFGGPSGTPIIAVNAIPFVCSAAPGIILQQNIPTFPPRYLRGAG